MDLENCQLCPRRCGVNRYQDRGFCGAGENAKLALVSLHTGEGEQIGVNWYVQKSSGQRRTKNNRKNVHVDSTKIGTRGRNVL